MSVETVFRGDLLSVRRSRLGQAVAATLIVLTAGVAVLVALVSSGSPPDVPAPEFGQIMAVIAFVLSFILPFVAMLASYGAIVREREHGSIRFLLGLPNSRAEAYLGKYASRLTLLAVPLVVGLVVAGVVGLAVLRDPDVGAFLRMVVLTVAYALVFLGFGLATSAWFDSGTRATAGIISVYVLFRAGWMVVQWGALRLALPRGERFVRPHPEWYYWLGGVNPMNAYNRLVGATLGLDGGAANPLVTVPTPEVSTVATSSGFAAAVLLAWLVVVPAAGYLRFRSRDVL